ncbi:MAG: hypothetical protein GC182_02980 [Rhodopseudomonas sp.]|nr:hypothetical protein [Rhodopseudomonas sp.]
MTEHRAILPETTFAEMAAILLLTINQGVIDERTEAFVAGINDNDSRRTFLLELDRLRRDNAVMVDLYRLIISLEPHEAAVRGLVDRLSLQPNSGRPVAERRSIWHVVKLFRSWMDRRARHNSQTALE